MHSEKIEYILSAYLRPTFLAITVDDERKEIEIIISCNGFKFMNIQERTSHVFSYIKEKEPTIFNEYLLIIQAYSGDELDSVLNDIFTNELK